MTRTPIPALALALAFGLGAAGATAQQQQQAPQAYQQLQSVQDQLFAAERRLSGAQYEAGQRPDYSQARQAVVAAEQALPGEGAAPAGAAADMTRTARQELAEARRLIEAEARVPQVVEQLRKAANAITTVTSATGASPPAPAGQGGGRQ